MQKLLVARLNACRFDVSLQKAWQLFKHQAQRENTRPVVRFSSVILPAYYAKDVVEASAEDGVTLKTALSALSGSKAVMPRFMYQQALTAKFALSDEAPIDFFDIFNNRYFRLFCLSEQKYQLTVRLEEERFDWNFQTQSISYMLSCLSGFNKSSDEIPQLHFIQYTALLGLKLTSPLALKDLLEDYFSLPFEIESSELEYFPLTPCSLTKLGKSGINQSLGIDALLGDSTPMLGQKLKVIICPQSYQSYLDIRHNQKMIKALDYLVRSFMGVNIKFKLCMKVSSHYLPQVQLTADITVSQRLGHATWMNNQSTIQQFVEMPLMANEEGK